MVTKRLHGHPSAPGRAGGIRLESRLGGLAAQNGLKVDRLRLFASALIRRYSGIASKPQKLDKVGGVHVDRQVLHHRNEERRGLDWR